MSRSDVVRRLRALATRGVPISVRYLLPVHADLVGQALAIFGSFDRARAIAALPAPPLEHDPDVIIGALRSLARSGVRLDVQTLSTMGESSLVAAAVDTFGSLAAATSRAGLGAPPGGERDSRRYGQGGCGGGGGGSYAGGTYSSGGGGYSGGGGGGGLQPGFAQPPISQDGQVSTALALEVLQKTALQLNRVPAARDLPPDVARRLTTDYGSVRFAYLALRVHAEGQGGGAQTAETAAQAASEPVANVSQEALAATARLSETAGLHRRNVDAAHAAAAAAPQPVASPPERIVEDVVDFDDAWAEVEAKIEEAAAAARVRLKSALGGALGAFVGEVTELARHATLAALVQGNATLGAEEPYPVGKVNGSAVVDTDDEEDEGDDEDAVSAPADDEEQ
jgi:hypothetical protein